MCRTCGECSRIHCNYYSRDWAGCEDHAILQEVVDLHLPFFCLLRLSCRILSATKVLSSAVLGAVSGVILPKSTGYMPRLSGAAVASTSSASSPGLEAASHGWCLPGLNKSRATASPGAEVKLLRHLSMLSYQAEGTFSGWPPGSGRLCNETQSKGSALACCATAPIKVVTLVTRCMLACLACCVEQLHLARVVSCAAAVAC